MRNYLASAMAITMALCLISAVIAFGGVTVENLAIPFVFAIVLALLWAVKLLFSDKISWPRSLFHLPVIGFTLYAVIRHVSSPVEYDSRVELLQIGLYAFIYFAAAFNLNRKNDRYTILLGLMALTVGESLYAIWQFAAKSDVVLYLNRDLIYHGRGSGTFICPNHLSGFLEMALGLFLARVALRDIRSSSAERETLRKIFFTYAALMAIAGIFVSLSRMGWVATIGGLVLLILWGDWNLRQGWPRLAIGFGAILFLLALTFMVPALRERVTMAAGPNKDVTSGNRTMLWGSSLSVVRDQPLWGAGPGTWQYVFPKHRDPKYQDTSEHAHSDVLELTTDYGIVGLLLVLTALGCFYWHAFHISRSDNSSDQRAFAVGSGIAVTAILVHSLFDFNMHIPANAMLFATIIGMTMGLEDKRHLVARLTMSMPWRVGLAVAVLLVAFAGTWYGTPMLLSHRFTSLGTDAKEILNWPKALEHFQRAVAHDPKFPEPYSKMGDIYSKQARFRRGPAREETANKAIDAFKKSLELNRFQVDIWLRLALAYELLGNNDEALKCYDKAIELDPNSYLVYFRLAAHHRQIAETEQDKEAAKRAYEKEKEAAEKAYNLKPDIFTLRGHERIHWPELDSTPPPQK